MVRSEAEKAAVATLLQRWRSGARFLTGYMVVAALALPLFAAWDPRLLDLAKAAGSMTAGGVALLFLVGIRNGWAGDTLAEWRPELARPAVQADNPRLGGTGSVGYVAALLTVAAAGMIVQYASAHVRATVHGTAHVRGCVLNRHRDGTPSGNTCYGTWTVAGKTYSGVLPKADVNIRYDPHHPATLGGQSLKLPIGLALFMGVIAGIFTWRWVTLARDPYMEELQMLAWRPTRTPQR
jgi:hypothetical protein